MNISGTHPQDFDLVKRLQGIRLGRGVVFGIIILVALFAFEAFNFSTTDYALRDVLGDLRFAGIRWATILTLAFCAIDFAGIARLFTPEQGGKEANEVWYLFGAWLLGATMNALLTWWGVSMAIANRPGQGSVVVEPSTLNTVVPIFVAIMVWLIRILIIGSLSYAGGRLFTQPERTRSVARPGSHMRTASRPVSGPAPSAPLPANSAHPAPKPVSLPEAAFNRPEPTYHRVSAQPRPAGPARTEPGVNPSVNSRR